MWRRVQREAGRLRGDFLTDPFALLPEMRLVSFEGPSALSRWTLNSDREHGGNSECTLTPAATDEDVAVFAGRTSLEMDHDRAASSPFHKKRSSKTGWCAMHKDVPEGEWEGLMEFHGLRLRLRTDERRYVLNMRTAGLLGGMDQDVFQAHIPPPPVPGEWAELRIPFCAFAVTWRGYVHEAQRSMNLEAVTRIGVLIADRQEGPFELQLQEIDAFRFDETEMREERVRRALSHNHELGYSSS